MGNNIVHIIATFGLLGTALGFIIGTSASQFIHDITECLILPIIEAIFNIGDHLGNISFKINRSNIKLGKTFLSFLNLMMVILVVYILYILLKPPITAITEEKSRVNEKLIEQNRQIIDHLRRIHHDLYNKSYQ